MNRLRSQQHQNKTDLKAVVIASAALTLFIPEHASAGDAAKRSWISIGGEFSLFSMTGFATRSGNSFMNINFNMSQRIHPDLWIGLSAFLGHDSDPTINRNYDQNMGAILHWFPFSLSSDSSVAFEGFQLSESETYRPFVSLNLTLGRILLRKVLTEFDATSDYLGAGLGAGLQYSISPSFSLSTSAAYQANIGLNPVPYSGQRISAQLGSVFQF